MLQLLRSVLTFEDALFQSSSTPSQLRSFNDQYEPAKVLAMSVSKNAQWRSSTKMPDGKTLQSLIRRYPKGNIWYLDDKGYFSSLEQVDALYGDQSVNASPLTPTKAPINLERQREEADVLSNVFKGARQIIFRPLWDAGESKCFFTVFTFCLLTEYRSLVFGLLSMEPIRSPRLYK